MPATLKLTHKATGAEVRRGTYDAMVDGEQAGSVDMNHTIEIPVDAAEDEIIAFRCTGKRLLPVFLASFAVPRLALKLVRD